MDQNGNDTLTKEYTLDIQATVFVEEGLEPHVARSNMITGFHLPEGRIIRPWVYFTIEDPEDDATEETLSYNELNKLGIHFDYQKREMEEV